MFPIKLAHQKEEDPIFQYCTHLIPFKRASDKIRRNPQEQKKKGPKATRPVDSGFKSKTTGTGYGLYQRFYWDEENVPFGGTPGF